MTRHIALFTAALVLVGGISVAMGQSDENPRGSAPRNVRIPGPDGVTIEAYLALPSGSGRRPAVLMIHEWWGLNNDIARMADALADEGYVVLAADAYRGEVARNVPGASSLVRGTPQERIAADLDAQLAWLRDHRRVDADRVASLGFCFGGTQSMRMGTRRSELAAVVIFYGGGPITDAGELGVMRQAGPVLGIYGEEDGNIPVSEVQAFEQALEEQDVKHTITIYPGVGHAFVKSDTYDNGETAEEAWNQMVAFLNDTL
jgi:carboxymethylenebutenolidase